MSFDLAFFAFHKGKTSLELIDSLIKKYDFVTVNPQAPPPDYISVG